MAGTVTRSGLESKPECSRSSRGCSSRQNRSRRVSSCLAFRAGLRERREGCFYRRERRERRELHFVGNSSRGHALESRGMFTSKKSCGDRGPGTPVALSVLCVLRGECSSPRSPAHRCVSEDESYSPEAFLRLVRATRSFSFFFPRRI